MALTSADFARIYKGFNASVSRFDCGRKCAPLNGGEPVCCSTQNAVPVAEKAEWDLLKSRTDLWHIFKPYDAPTRKIKEDLTSTCRDIECKGARFCERDNRTIACRSFPFFPYINRAKQFIGLSIYWDFQDRCWMMSNMQVVDQKFIDEFCTSFEVIFAKDKEEFDTFVDFSATMRRVFSRWKRPIPMLGRDGSFNLIMPGTGEIKQVDAAALPKMGPFRSETAYRRAVREANGAMPSEGLVAV